MMTAAELKTFKDAFYADQNRRPGRPEFLGGGVPASLRPLPQWVPWKLHWKADPKKPGKGKWDKIPLNPHSFNEKSGCLKWAKANDPTTWGDYAAAREAANKTAKRDKGNSDGLGFAFARRGEEGEFGLDIDCCRDPKTGELSPTAARVLREFATYADVSPSGTGVKLLGRGRLPWDKGRKVVLPTGEEFELYDQGRFFTVTGRRVEGTPPELADGQPALDALIAEFLPPEEPAPRAKGKGRRPDPILAPDDAKVVELIRRRHDALWHGDTSRHGGDDSRADLALCNLLAFYTHNDADRIDLLFRQSGLMRGKWDERADYRGWTIGKATAGRTEFYDPGYRRAGASTIGRGPPGAAGPPPDQTGSTGPRAEGGRPTVAVGTNEWEVIRQVYAALARGDESLFVREGKLVSVVCDPPLNGQPVAPRVAELATPEVRTRITRYVRLVEFNPRSKEMEDTNPPNWLAPGVAASTTRAGIRHLAAVSTSPVLRTDGTVHQTPGHDPATGVLYIPEADSAPIPEHPTWEDARRAAELLLAGVRQFPWQAAVDQAVWLSAALTLAARHSFAGPAPLFVGVANHPEAGKTALTHAAGIIGTGREVPVEAYPMKQVGRRATEDNEELRKLKTAALVAGHPAYCLDNVPNGHQFGSHVIDSLVTSTVDAGRLTGTGSAAARASLTVWFVNGNGICPVRDTVRRSLPYRLFVPDPRARQLGFDGMEVKAWARGHRGDLFAAAVTVVAAYIRAGRPDQHLPHFGSFEAWSDTIRSAIVWAGFPDPRLAQHEYTANTEDDQEADHLMNLLFDLEPGRGPLTAAQILDLLDADLKAGPVAPLNHPVALFHLRSVIPAGRPDADKLGKLFRSHRGRVVKGRCVTGKPNRKGIVSWSVEVAGPQSTSGSDHEATGRGEG